MQIEVTQVDIIETKDGVEFKHTPTMMETRAEGRHSMICNICGFSTYPKCREWCNNGRDE